MKKRILWNNKRHSFGYWKAIMLLSVVSVNLVSVMRKENIIKNKYIHTVYNCFITQFNLSKLETLIMTMICIYIIIFLLIFIMNIIIGLIPDVHFLHKLGSYNYLLKFVMIEDIILGILLEYFSVKGLIELGSIFKLSSIAFWLYIVLFLYGSVIYWKNTIILKQIKQAEDRMKNVMHDRKNICYCINNCNNRISSFSIAPWRASIDIVIVDKEDIIRGSEIKVEMFQYFLIIIDCNQQLTDNFVKNIEEIVEIPHSIVRTFIFGDDIGYKRIIEFLTCQKNVRLLKYPCMVNINNFDYENKIIEKLNENESCKFPLEFLEDKYLIDLYNNIKLEPVLCLNFMKIIINKLEMLPAIYALFDYIDMEYRIRIAYMLDSGFSEQYKFMKKKWHSIGNIRSMSQIVYSSVNKKYNELLTVQYFFSKIITDKENKMIYKYIPDYKIGKEENLYDVIINLTVQLRNALRGHGSFELQDSNILFEIIFKLALLNIYLLKNNQIHILLSDKPEKNNLENKHYIVSGSIDGKKWKLMSPFIIANTDKEILIFNNIKKNGEHSQIEYVNYLNGKLSHYSIKE